MSVHQITETHTDRYAEEYGFVIVPVSFDIPARNGRPSYVQTGQVKVWPAGTKVSATNWQKIERPGAERPETNEHYLYEAGEVHATFSPTTVVLDNFPERRAAEREARLAVSTHVEPGDLLVLPTGEVFRVHDRIARYESGAVLERVWDAETADA